jgi:hypothetical protein
VVLVVVVVPKTELRVRERPIKVSQVALRTLVLAQLAVVVLVLLALPHLAVWVVMVEMVFRLL